VPVPTRRRVTSVRVRAVDGTTVAERPDRLVTEEPLEIRVHGPGQAPQPLAVTMRTPGDDFELAVGFLITEQLATPGDVASVTYCVGNGGGPEYNLVNVGLTHPVSVHGRTFPVNASCGLCGATTIDDALRDTSPVGPGPIVSRSVLVTLPDRLRDRQAVFAATGGLHAAGLFTARGDVIVLREDVGRHNALDKVVGHLALHGDLPARDTIVAVSGRLSYEIVQKSAVAGISVLCAVSAPSSLAVDAARRVDQTLVGFLRGDRFNVYTGSERVDLDR
jgi:FdhD protein